MVVEHIYLEEKMGGKENGAKQRALEAIFELYDYIRYYVLLL